LWAIYHIYVYILTLRIFFEIAEGPFAAKDGIMGAGLKSMTETVGRIVATGLLHIKLCTYNRINL